MFADSSADASAICCRMTRCPVISREGLGRVLCWTGQTISIIAFSDDGAAKGARSVCDRPSRVCASEGIVVPRRGSSGGVT